MICTAYIYTEYCDAEGNGKPLRYFPRKIIMAKKKETIITALSPGQTLNGQRVRRIPRLDIIFVNGLGRIPPNSFGPQQARFE